MAIDNTPMLVPHLVVDGAAAALDFYAEAFGAEEMVRLPGPGGRLMHAAFRINGHTVFVNDDFPEFCDGRMSTPTALGGTPVTVHLHGPDVRARFQRAIDAGATVVNALEEMFWGDLYGVVRDPFGHNWSLAETVREVDMNQVLADMNAEG